MYIFPILRGHHGTKKTWYFKTDDVMKELFNLYDFFMTRQENGEL